MCHSDSGKCTDGCTRGFYGGLCQQTCGVCLDGVCDQKTGTCTIGCNLTGRKCDSDSSIADLKIGLSAAFSLFVVIILLALSPVYCKHLRFFKQHTIQGIIPHEAPRHEDQVPPDYCEIRDEDVDIVCELPGIRGDDSVTGAAPVMPVLADCFVADCDSSVNDVAAAEESPVDDNTYTHLVRPVVVEWPETVVNYVPPIEE
ncbi:uncharacterized protein LOC125379290 [Haliotis rufescens]|uniref:uncharacterized protein LOC125379290 n=1 Tax=Haliotis rufescens TaxID=6454 RepID=UPI00201F426E|nr:uncharacterized protein LOC125379290 [Haliotis rufescens]